MVMTSRRRRGQSGGPFNLIARSWGLTAGHVWKLVGLPPVWAILIGILTRGDRAVAESCSRSLPG